MNKNRQKGFVLISALIFLILMIYLGLAMFRGFGLDEMMAGNLREKARATEAAQAAVEYAELWLTLSGNATAGAPCTTAGALATPTICTGAEPSPNSALTTYTTFTNSAINVASSGVGTYFTKPIYAIYHLGLDPQKRRMYSITAQATGGNQNAVASIQTVYRVGCNVCDLGG